MMNKIMRWEKAVIPLLGLSLLSNGYFVFTHWDDGFSSLHVETTQKFPLLSKRIFTENPNDILLNFIPLRQALREYVNAQNGNVGVYFEYLPSGISIGVNDREEVRLASLSKVPLAMSIMKKIERGELKLDTKVTIEEKHLDKKFGELWKKGAGSVHTIEDLIKYSLQQSDNTAYDTLFAQLDSNEINEVYENLDIEVTPREGRSIVSPKSYSSIFRSLYLSSFLIEEHSSYLLDILTQTDFKDKIPSGVAKGVPVAHKIGVFSRTDTTEDVFIDCGIIYMPSRPYVLCIFVQGEDMEAQKHMSYISKMIYSYLTIVQGGK